MKITEAHIVRENKDQCSLTTEIPDPSYGCDCLCLNFSVPRGLGEEYIKKYFGVEPIVIDMITERLRFTS